MKNQSCKTPNVVTGKHLRKHYYTLSRQNILEDHLENFGETTTSTNNIIQTNIPR